MQAEVGRPPSLNVGDRRLQETGDQSPRRLGSTVTSGLLLLPVMLRLLPVMLRAEAGRNPHGRLGLPRAIERRADLPASTVGPDEPTIVKVDVRVSDHYVDAQSRVEQKLGSALMLAPMPMGPMGSRVSRRPRLMNDDRLARMRRQYNTLTTTECDDRHRYRKTLCKTKHSRYPHNELGLSAYPGLALIPAV